MTSRVKPLRAPFPYFGGKSRVADVVWRALGRDVPNYCEPFAGSLAVLLGRPGGAGKIETVNDAYAAIPNAWRAISQAPEEVARWCDWPVSEVDMHARNRWLIARLTEIRPRLMADPGYFDAQAAGWWIWGACAWIGGGWASKESPGRRPHLGVNGHGVGVHASRLPSIGNDRGLNGISAPPAGEWMRLLSERLRCVHVVCGDWTRVMGASVLGKGKNVGGRRPCAVFLDPPYSHELRDPHLYSEDDARISEQVGEWAREHGGDPELRIALCGYEGEHDLPGWKIYKWKAARGYAGPNNDNRERETVWFSPHCLPLDEQPTLFGSGDTWPEPDPPRESEGA